MSRSSISISSISSMQGLDEEVNPSKSLMVLNTMMKILSSLTTLSSSQIEAAYKMAYKDKRYKLPDNQKYYLFKELSQLRSIVKIISLQDEQSSSLWSPVALVQDKDGELILSRWSVDQADRKDTQILLQSMDKERVKRAQIICLEREEVFSLGNQKSLNSIQSLTHISKSPSLRSIDSNHQVYSSPPSVEKPVFLTETLKLKDSARTTFGYTQPPPSSLQYYNPVSWQEPTLKNSQYQMKSMKKNNREEGIQRALQILGNTKLHSSKLIKEYGEIPYKVFFRELITNPEDARNRRWIKMFKDPFSDNWKHDCLQALKVYFRNYD